MKQVRDLEPLFSPITASARPVSEPRGTGRSEEARLAAQRQTDVAVPRTNTPVGTPSASDFDFIVESQRAIIKRLDQLKNTLPSMAMDASSARQSAAQLRSENAELRRKVVQLEVALGMPQPRGHMERSP